MNFTLRVAAVTRVLAVITALLVLLALALQVVRWSGDHHTIFGLLDLFELDREENVPTLFNTLLLLISAALLATNGLSSRGAKLPAAGWFGLAAIFAWLAIDEAWQVHERSIWPLRELLPPGAPAWTHFAWVIPGALVVIAIAAAYLRFLQRLTRATRSAIIFAGCVYLAGALGMEVLDGAWAATRGEDNFVYSLLTTLEESLELIGLVLFIRALLHELTARGSVLSIRFAS